MFNEQLNALVCHIGGENHPETIVLVWIDVYFVQIMCQELFFLYMSHLSYTRFPWKKILLLSTFYSEEPEKQCICFKDKRLVMDSESVDLFAMLIASLGN